MSEPIASGAAAAPDGAAAQAVVTPPPLAPPPATPPATPLAAPSAAAPDAWPRWQRVGFRYVALYYLLYAFPGAFGSLLGTVTGGLAKLDVDVSGAPWTWAMQGLGKLDSWWDRLTTWMGAVGVAPYEVIHQPTGSGDTGSAFARLLFIGVVAAAGTLGWSLLSKARGYPRLGRWLHLLVRFDLAFTLFGYGFAKFYGGQFGELSLMRLTQEIGDTWPMTMVGTFMQASKPYELFGGACEVLGGLLLFHRRTALLGACVSIVTMTNVCAINWLQGVPVKLYSTHLLLYGVFLLAPFREPLIDVFLRNRSSSPVDLRVVRGRFAGALLLLFGVAWVGASVTLTHLRGREPKSWMQGREKSELYGLWTVETMLRDGVEVPLGDATRWREFAIDRGTLAWTRDLSGTRRFLDFSWKPASGGAQVKERGKEGDGVPWTTEPGVATVKGDAPHLLRNEERGKQVDVERRTLRLKGQWDGHELELRTVEKKFRLQTGFRLRQELPDFW